VNNILLAGILRGSEHATALAYIGAHLTLGFGSVFAGRAVADLMFR